MLPAPSDLPRWRALIQGAFGGPNPVLSWLEPVWHGEVGRVILYQMFPAAVTPYILWDEEAHRRAVHAPDGKRIQPDPRVRVSIVPELLSPAQLRLYEAFGCIGQPFWVVEGVKGGHKRQFTPIERRLLKATGHSGEPPVIGSQPYAPVDQRVIDALRPLDQVRQWALMTAFFERSPDQMDAETKATMEGASREVTKWLADQVAWAFDSEITYKRKLDLRSTDAPMPDLDRMDAEIHQAA